MKYDIKELLLIVLSGLVIGGVSLEMFAQEDGKSTTVVTMDVPEPTETPKGYYEENRNLIINEKQKNVDYQVYYYTLEKQKKEEYLKYLQTYQNYLQELLNIEEGKLELGYSTYLEVEQIRQQLKDNQVEIENVKEQQSLNGEHIEVYVTADVPYQKKTQELDVSKDYIAGYLEEDSQIAYYNYEIKEYEEYLKDSPKAENYEEIKIKKEITQMDLEQYQKSLKVYVQEKISEYETLKRNISNYESKLELQEEKISLKEELYQSGRATKLEVQELQVEYEKLYYEKKSLQLEVDHIIYILNRHIRI